MGGSDPPRRKPLGEVLGRRQEVNFNWHGATDFEWHGATDFEVLMTGKASHTLM